MNAVENFHSSENYREIDWVLAQTQEALKSLKAEADPEKKFYEKNGENVTPNMDVVKDYLDLIKDKNWSDLQSNNSTAWIMAVQIALESMGYEVGTIDGLLGSKTKAAVVQFESANSLQVDAGLPGKEVMTKLVELLDANDKEPKAKNNLIAYIGDSVKNPNEYIDNIPEGATVEWKSGANLQLNKEGESKGIIIIKQAGKNDIEIQISVTVASEDLRDEDKTYSDGSTYVGTVDREGKKQGYGTLKSPVKGLRTDWEYEGEFKDDLMNGEGTYKWNYGKNSFKGKWENGKITKCESYGNTIDVKYDENGVAFIETKSGWELSLEGLKCNEGEFVSLINYIIYTVKNNNGGFKLEYFEKHGNKLQADYKDYVWDTDLIKDVTKYGIDADTLANWLNEYRKDVNI